MRKEREVSYLKCKNGEWESNGWNEKRWLNVKECDYEEQFSWMKIPFLFLHRQNDDNGETERERESEKCHECHGRRGKSVVLISCFS